MTIRPAPRSIPAFLFLAGLGLLVPMTPCASALAAYPIPEDTNAPIVAGEVTAPAAAVYSCIVIDDLLAPSNAYSRRLCAFRETSYSDGRSERVPISRGYTEVATGINYLDADGAWKQAAVEPRVMADGSVAFDKLLTRLTFAANANLDTVVTALKPDGSTIRSAVAALAYRDRASGRTAVIAVPKESQVQIVEEGVCYTNAFDGVDADILYVVNRSGLEQDIVVYGDVPPPEWFDIHRTGAVLCVMTELIGLRDVDWAAQRPDGSAADSPDGGVIHLAVRNGDQWRRAESFHSGSAWVQDGALDIGARALRKETNAQPVQMSLVVAEDHRVFLIEESPFELLEELDGLAAVEEHRPASIVSTPPRRPVERDVDFALFSPQPQQTAVNSSSVHESVPGRTGRKLVLDYFTYSAMTNDVILETGETYYISDPINFDGYLYGFPTLTIAPGCYVKFHPAASIKIDSGATLDCRSHLLAPALFTSVYDTNNGAQIVAGFVGDPATNRVGCALFLSSLGAMRGLEIRYAEVGVRCDSNAELLDSKFRHCGTAIDVDGGSLDIGNVLVQDSHVGVDISYSCSARIHGSTFDTITNTGLAMNYMSYASLTNNVFVSLTNGILRSSYPYQTSAAVNAFWNSKTNFTGVSPIALTSSPFAAGPYGSHYLYQSGSWLVNSGLQAATYWKLYHRTTSANGDKETNSTADIGFHYGTTNDVDGDGVADFIEDTSGDGSFDLADVSDLGDADTDDDSLSDGLEYFTYYTGPRTQDTDGDGAWDGAEVDAGTDPLDSNSVPISIAGMIGYSGGQTGLIHLRAAEVETGLVFHYPFDVDQGTNVMDASGCGHHGVVTGAVHVTNGYRGGAYYFDGTGDYIRVTNSSLDGSSRFTLAAWVKASLSNSPDPANGLFGKHRAGNNYHSFWIFQEGTNLRAQLWGPNWTPANIITSMTSFAAAWTHVAITYDGATFSVFTNGSLVAAQSMPGYTGNTHALMIGAGEYKVGTSTPDRFWRGFIDEVKGYNRALGPEEISRLWSTGTTAVKVFATNMPSPGPYTLSGLHAYRSYDVDAYRDSNTNFVLDGSEASGVYSGNSFYASASQSNMNVTLIDPDSDGDTLPDWWEAKYGLSTSDGAGVNGPAGDPDEDGISNLDEYNACTDPTDKYSVPPPSMLCVSGKYIVDAQTNKVILKSVNIGGWLQWEQWMMQYQPYVITNDWGKVYNGEMDEATAVERLASNIDFSVTLLATNASAVSGLTTQASWAAWLCDSNVKFLGGMGNGEWLCFSNKNFGSGVSNVSIALAVPSNDAGRQIEVRLGAANGPILGTVTTKSTGPFESDYKYYCAFTEQSLVISNLAGNQTIFFVGKSTGGDVANIYRVRFWRDDNTKALVESFRDRYFLTNDLDTIKSLGYNCIRLPFFHTMLEDDLSPYSYKTSGWARLDRAVEECRKRRMWVILDLHSTPGGQNPYHSSGLRDPFRDRMWSSDSYKDRTEKLWAAVAARYKTNAAVAGYDLFNEPDSLKSNETTIARQLAFSNGILPMVSRLHTAIRSNDTNHVVFLEGNFLYTNMWDDIGWWPDPRSNGWTNVCFEFHVYDQTVYGKNGVDDWWFSTQKGICDNMVRAFTRLSEARQTPVYVGEFAPWDERNMDYWIRQCEANGIHWGHWNYRTWGWDNTSTPYRGWTLWGLNYRSAATTNQKPDLGADSWATLTNKFADYNATNYVANPFLQKVVQDRINTTNAAARRCDFYVNSFDGPDSVGASAGWPWKKAAAVSSATTNIVISAGRARLGIGSGPVVVRAKSREEVDARFEINDSVGIRISVEPSFVKIISEAAGAEAEMRLACVREEITSALSNYDTRGIIARIAFDKNGASTNVSFSLWSKGGGTNTYGVLLFTNAPVAFLPGTNMELDVTKSNSTLSYAGTVLGTAIHTNLDAASWQNGAVAVVEAAELAAGSAPFMEVDNFKAWRPTATNDEEFTDGFTNYVNGITLLTEAENLTMQEYWAPSRKTESFATNASAFWIPKEWNYGGTWMCPRRDYQNDVRVLASPTNVVEVRASYSNLTQGVAKICAMPELFTGEVYGEYAGNALYVECERQGDGQLKFSAFRHYATQGGRAQLQTNAASYADGRLVSFQCNAATVRVYYGSSPVLDTPHGLTNYAGVYANGIYPHFEFQNWATTTNAAVFIDDTGCRHLATFAAP
jgi:hypothetical protein